MYCLGLSLMNEEKNKNKSSAIFWNWILRINTPFSVPLIALIPFKSNRKAAAESQHYRSKIYTQQIVHEWNLTAKVQFWEWGDEINLERAINHGRPSVGKLDSFQTRRSQHFRRRAMTYSMAPACLKFPRSLTQNHIWTPIKGFWLSFCEPSLDHRYLRVEAKSVSSIWQSVTQMHI